MTCVTLRMTAIFLAASVVNARAADDWIDELPTVTAVAHASTDELKVTTANWRFDLRGIELKDDDDLAAVTLSGTLVLIRKIILYKFQEESSLSIEREGKLRAIVAAYEEAELVIGQATGNRRGYLTTAQKCRDMECHRRWFKTHMSNVYIGAEYRKRILTRLFSCERAQELDRLAQSYALRAPFLPSPSVTLSIDPELKGIAPPGCSAYGGDMNRNGLCDEWETPPSTKITADAGTPECAPVAMSKVRMAQGGGLRVTFDKDGARPGMRIKFVVKRSDKPVVDAKSVEILSDDAVVQGPSGSNTDMYAIIAPSVSITPEESKPYLLVEAVGGRTAKPVHCEQPISTWLQRQLNSGPEGLHGPYPSANQAVVLAGQIALQLTTAEHETGFLILRDIRSTQGGYYAMPPGRSKKTLTFTPEDYGQTVLKAFENSCEEMENFALAATVHTHPDSRLPFLNWPSDFPVRMCVDSSNDPSCFRNDYFSMADFSQAIQVKNLQPNAVFIPGKVNLLSRFEKIILISARTRCIQTFTPEDSDEPFTLLDEASEFITLEIIPRLAAERYEYYWQRQQRVHCYTPTP